MLTSQLALRYAQAIYELAAEKQELETVEGQLAMVEEALAASGDLATLLFHPQVPIEAKKDTVVKIFGSDLAEYVRNFLFLIIDKRRESALPAIIREYRALANQARNIAEAEVTTALPLNEAETKSLATRLSSVSGKNVVLKTRIDSRILGGVIVKIGDKLIDGSVLRQLEALKSALLKTEVTKIGVTN
ncbi:MAG TPA: F0F1 ATP synthase subunit delta [Selenomonadales bacterium]|nr:F0F1 ATP synthase subunit delta [Selenomonadales bacterium]